MVRRLLLIACAGVLALPAAAQSANPPRASAQLDRCHPSLDAAQRYAVFSGAMRSLRAARTAWRCASTSSAGRPGRFAFKRVAAPGLGVWKRADPGVGRLKFRQKVENLTAPAAYRAVVSFRWISANGRVFARAQHVTRPASSPICGRTCASAGSPAAHRRGHRQYDVTVRNDGALGRARLRREPERRRRPGRADQDRRPAARRPQRWYARSSRARAARAPSRSSPRPTPAAPWPSPTRPTTAADRGLPDRRDEQRAEARPSDDRRGRGAAADSELAVDVLEVLLHGCGG